MTNEELHVAVVTLELQLAALTKQVEYRGKVLHLLTFAIITPMVGYIIKGLLFPL